MPPGSCGVCAKGMFQTNMQNAGGDDDDGWQVCHYCPEGFLQPFDGQTQCLRCPSGGVDCAQQAKVVLRRSWYRDLPANTTEPVVG